MFMQKSFLCGIQESNHSGKGEHHSDHSHTQSQECVQTDFCGHAVSSKYMLLCALPVSPPDGQVSLGGI